MENILIKCKLCNKEIADNICFYKYIYNNNNIKCLNCNIKNE